MSKNTIDRQGRHDADSGRAFDKAYGYNDKSLVPGDDKKSVGRSMLKSIGMILAMIFLISVWFALDQKLLLGGNWLSETYDVEDWRTNEGNLHTYGAWDLEAHIWKTEFIMKYFPH